MKTILLSLLLALAPAAWSAVKPGSLGAGIRIGDMTGVDLKFWVDRSNALHLGVGSIAGNAVALQATYLWHRYGLFHSERDDLENNLPLYFGAGGIFAGSASTPYGTAAALTGIKGTVGISYLFAPEPFDLFLELSPTVYVGNYQAFLFHAGLGGRYYF